MGHTTSRKKQRRKAEAATSSQKMATSSPKIATSSPEMASSAPKICKPLIKREFEQSVKVEPVVRRSMGRLNSTVMIGPRQRLTSVSMVSPDPEVLEWERDSYGGLAFFPKQSGRKSDTGVSRGTDLEGTGENYSIRGSSTFRLPNIMTAASLSIGSPDPEVFDISEWNVKQRGFSLGAYRESSLGKFISFDNSITLTLGVMVCNSFHEYHLRRDEIIKTPYEIHLEEYNKKWARDAEEVCKMLDGMDSSKKYWHKVQHIGSTSIPDMVAKPIIDIMITLTDNVKFKEAIDEFLREQFEIKKELPVKIGFTGKAPFSNDNWGFFQVPREWAEKVGICEVNIHIFDKNSTNAVEKNLFRNYLTSPEGHVLKMEYCEIKGKLMKELNGGLKVADYALRKNEIVSKILDKAYIWNFKNDDVKEPVLGKPTRKAEHSTTCPTDINLTTRRSTLEAKEEKLDESNSDVEEQKRKSRIKSKT